MSERQLGTCRHSNFLHAKDHHCVDFEPRDRFDVFEVYGKSARSKGWDFLVCKSLPEALDIVEEDLDSLEQDGVDEVRIVFKEYTQEQMDEVVYE